MIHFVLSREYLLNFHYLTWMMQSDELIDDGCGDLMRYIGRQWRKQRPSLITNLCRAPATVAIAMTTPMLPVMRAVTTATPVKLPVSRKKFRALCMTWL
jgi:hypothetical protein